MGRITHLILVIVLAYVCVLNAVVINIVYKKYLMNTKALPPPQIRRLRNKTAPVVHRTSGTVCEREREMRAIAMVTGEQTDSNDVSSRAPALAQLRHALRASGTNANVFLVVTAESFVGSHRAWCNALYTQTNKVAGCQLLLLQKPVSPVDVFRRVLEVAPCASELVLLPDLVQIKSNFFTRLEQTKDNRVTCLLKETTHQNACPVSAFRVPKLFLEAYTGEASVETAARGMHMYAGGVAVVGLG